MVHHILWYNNKKWTHSASELSDHCSRISHLICKTFWISSKNFSWVVGSKKVFYPIFRSNASKAKKMDYRLWQSKTKAKGSNKKGLSRMFDFQNNNVHSLRLWLGTNTLNTCEFEITSSQFLVDQPLRITVEATNILRNTKIL